MIELQFAIKISNLCLFSGRLQIGTALLGALIYLAGHGLH